MAAAAAEEKPAKSGGGAKEGSNLLGEPTFEQLQNGRFRCVETGHELPAHARDSYAHSKRCRVGLIDYGLAKKKPPLNMFKQDPLNRFSPFSCFLLGNFVLIFLGWGFCIVISGSFMKFEFASWVKSLFMEVRNFNLICG